MLSLLKIKNVALIDELQLEFGAGLNLLTGETGSGKSIIVDSLGALTGDRVTTDLIKNGESSASIEGLFEIRESSELDRVLSESGIESSVEIIIRREIAATGKNRIFINGNLATQTLLKKVGNLLVDIHGQGEQAELYRVATHARLLDSVGGYPDLLVQTSHAYDAWSEAQGRLAALDGDIASKLQLIDVLKFQVAEIRAVAPDIDEESTLEEEKRRLGNVEKLTTVSEEAFKLLYDQSDSTAETLEKAQKRITELNEIDARFAGYDEGLANARAVIEDLAFALRDYRTHLEFSPDRLNEIENRLSELTRLKRKYGGSIETVLAHLAESEERLAAIESSEHHEEELKKEVEALRLEYLSADRRLHEARLAAGGRLSKQIEKDLKAVALEKARFEVRIDPSDDEARFSRTGSDLVEFYFSANPGESLRPLVRVASGGEASRVMLTLKTAIGASESRTAVFDEVDVGIGGRVAESVGRKLSRLSVNQQVLCVTHQPQIASLADIHYIVEKSIRANRTAVSVRRLGQSERVEEIARMLAGEAITDAARENARVMLASAGSK